MNNFNTYQTHQIYPSNNYVPPQPIYQITPVPVKHEKIEIVPAEAPKKKAKKRRRKDEPKVERTRNPEKWKNNVIKKACLTGQAYVNRSGNYVAAKEMGPPCNCPRNCFNEKRQPKYEELFKQFYQMKSKEIQDTYLCGLIQSCEVKTRRPKDNSKGPNSATNKYFLKIPNEFIQVCRTAFCAVHAISTRRVQRLAKAVKNNVVSPEDKRGKHTGKPELKSPVILEQVERQMKRYIVPPQNKWMTKGLTLKKMHQWYLQEFEPNVLEDTKKGGNTKPIVSFFFYRAYFKKHINLPFGEPKK